MKTIVKKINVQVLGILEQLANKYFKSADELNRDIPVNKMLVALGFDFRLHYDKWSANKAYHAVNNHNKKWIGQIVPVEILERSFKKAIESIVTLSESGIFYKYFPKIVVSPNYGDNWGRNANYIEINNRSIAEMIGNKCSSGLISTIKMLPAIPPSAKSWANCVVLSQIFPNIFGDGYNKAPWEENSIYGIKLNAGYSRNIVNYDILNTVSAEDQFRAFNDLAHFRGIKTGFRTVISEDQIKIANLNKQDENFRWNNDEHLELYIKEHVKLIKLGFEAIFVDSAKHIGGVDCANYTGVGRLPSYEQMQYILHEIRLRSGNNALSFVGEKSSIDFDMYKNMGLTAGTALVSADYFDEVKRWSEWFKYRREYAPGPEVSNDNDWGGSSYEQRLNRINSCLFGFEFASDKLPSFMQMEDLFPLRYDTSTHHLMMFNPSYSIDNTPISHWKNLFTAEDGRWYNHLVGEKFAYALDL